MFPLQWQLRRRLRRGELQFGKLSSGNCAMTTNSVPAGGLAPRPDPANGSRSVEQRLDTIERELNIVPNRNSHKDKTYAPNDGFNSVPARGSGGFGTETTIPSKRPGSTRDDEFQAPTPGRTDDDSNEPFKENPTTKQGSFKPPTNEAGDNGITIPGEIKKPAPGEPIDKDKGQSLRLDSRVTSRAVAPRERLAIRDGATKPAVASAKKPVGSKLQVDAHPRTVNLARH